MARDHQCLNKTEKKHGRRKQELKLPLESTGQKANSEPNLQLWTSESPRQRGTSGVFEGFCGYPPGFTVDELSHFRRKKAPGNIRPIDNLRQEGGSLQKIKSEYKRCFKPNKLENSSLTKPLDSFHLNDNFQLLPEYKEKFIQYHPDFINNTKAKQVRETPVKKEEKKMLVSTEQRSQYVPFEGVHRQAPVKRSTTIPQPTDDFEKKSEIHDKYIKHLDAKRAQLTRRPTNLKFDGEILTTTESAEKFIEYLISQRRELLRHPSNLKLEGEMNTETECMNKYVPFEVTRRKPLEKINNNLHLEGELLLEPEYKQKFKILDLSDRPTLMKKNTTLKLEGDLDFDSQYKKSYGAVKSSDRRTLARHDTNLHLEGDMDLEPEYRRMYKMLKLSSRPPLAKIPTNLNLEGDLILDPEYPDMFKIYAPNKISPSIPNSNLKIERGNTNITESASQFVKYPIESFRTTESIKQKPNLYLEGAHEYNSNYTRDYVQHNLNNLRMETTKQNSNLFLEGKHDFNSNYQESYGVHESNKSIKQKPVNELKTSEDKFNSVSENNDQFKPPESTKKREPYRGHDNILLEGKIDMNPEYKNAYIDFHRSKPITKKSDDGTIKSDSGSLRKKRSKSITPVNVTIVDVVETSPGHTSPLEQFKDKVSVPNSMKKTQGDAGKVNVDKRNKKITIEKPSKQENSDLPYDGKFQCQPEYRKAYIHYITREQNQRARALESSNLKDNKSEEVDVLEVKTYSSRKSQTDFPYTKAFEVLCTKGTDVEEKRLASFDINTPDKNANIDKNVTINKIATINKNANTDKNKLPPKSPRKKEKDTESQTVSPSYRLHVHNVDDPGGFLNRKRRSRSNTPTGSPSRRSSNSSADRSPRGKSESPIRRRRWDTNTRVPRRDSLGQAFLVLNADEVDVPTDIKLNDQNTERKQDRSKWMPPWYTIPK